MKKFSDKCNFHTLAMPHRKYADSQEIRQMLEDSDKWEADLSGPSDDSAGDKTFQPASRDGEISSSEAKIATTVQFRKIKWYIEAILWNTFWEATICFSHFTFFMILYIWLSLPQALHPRRRQRIFLRHEIMRHFPSSCLYVFCS